MATTFQWATPEALTTALSTELNSLANGSFSSAYALDNESGLYQFINFELVLASLTPVAGQCVGIYIMAAVDSTPNYPDANAVDNLVAVLALSTSTSAKRKDATNILIPPFKLNITVGNISITSGVAFGASGNTLKFRRHNGQGV